MKSAFHDAREILHAIHAINALAERPVNFVLICVDVEIDFLMRMAAVVMRGNVSGNHHHGDRIERGVGNAGGGICQSRTKMREQNARLTRRARVAIGGMRCNLFVPRGDEANLALA